MNREPQHNDQQAMDIRLLLVSKEGIAREKYQEAIKKLGMQFDVVSSFKELYSVMINRPYNGLMVDVQTKIMSYRDDKHLVHDILENYPVVQLNYESRTEKIRTFFFGQFKGGGSLEDFIARECRLFPARKARLHERKNIHFNVILSTNGNFNEKNCIRTVTLNASKGGCFMISGETWEPGRDVWFRMKELVDDSPMRGQVRWKADWGCTMRIPGMGLSFEDITESQLIEICDKL